MYFVNVFCWALCSVLDSGLGQALGWALPECNECELVLAWESLQMNISLWITTAVICGETKVRKLNSRTHKNARDRARFSPTGRLPRGGELCWTRRLWRGPHWLEDSVETNIRRLPELCGLLLALSIKSALPSFCCLISPCLGGAWNMSPSGNFCRLSIFLRRLGEWVSALLGDFVSVS